jgi:hypothetical protein
LRQLEFFRRSKIRRNRSVNAWDASLELRRAEARRDADWSEAGFFSR